VSQWPSRKARVVLGALLRAGWRVKRSRGSHRVLEHPDPEHPDFVWAFHDREELGPRILARVAKKTGLRPGDL
jgi:predicted RNA binding protein YcfA (HicA-like mRNA interferase family)